MCGIVSVLSLENQIISRIVKSLERLEYRGYDSSGIAVIDCQNKLQRIRSVGKIEKLKEKIGINPINSSTGIGHTRWATHGKVTESNAHPHRSGGVCIVHNGIIENYQELRETLTEKNFEFESETDTEVIAKLIDFKIQEGKSFTEAFKSCLDELQGTFAIVAIFEAEPNLILGAKRGSPMAIAQSDDEKSFYIASDAIALSTLSSKIAYLEENDIVIAIKNADHIDFHIENKLNKNVIREFISNSVSLKDVSKNGYESFMLKEIFEEPQVAINTFNNFNYDLNIKDYGGLTIIACGTSYYAGLLAKYWIEDICGTPVDVEIASEFRYRNPALSKNRLYIFISQSGETIDTLCAMRLVKEKGIKTLALVNVETSSIAREADLTIKTLAGVEIGVASTKAFISQTLSMLLLCVKKDDIAISKLELALNEILNDQFKIKKLAEKLKDSRSLLYIGRGTSYPIALEGALKVKELSYISAQGYPCGEIKHGPIAIIDESVYTVVLAPLDKHFEKTISNTQEILARHGKIIFVTTENAREKLKNLENNESIDIFYMKDIDQNKLLQPFALTSFVHILAYYVAKAKELDVDKPRNLAKSVTVE